MVFYRLIIFPQKICKFLRFFFALSMVKVSSLYWGHTGHHTPAQPGGGQGGSCTPPPPSARQKKLRNKRKLRSVKSKGDIFLTDEDGNVKVKLKPYSAVAWPIAETLNFFWAKNTIPRPFSVAPKTNCGFVCPHQKMFLAKPLIPQVYVKYLCPYSES